MEFAIEHSNSKVAELEGKLKSNELVVEHLKCQLDECKGDREKVEKAQVSYVLKYLVL